MSSALKIALVCLVQVAEATDLSIQPYLQWPQEHGITVMWETTEPTVGELRYGPTPDLDLSAIELEPRLVHEVQLTGLLPQTRYFYKVRTGNGWTELASFRTMPGREDRWRMLVYGDSRSFPERHQRIAALARQHDPDLVVHTGDQVTRGTQRPQWKSQFFDPAAPLFSRVPLITSLGNHEENAGNYFEYFSLPGNEKFFSVDFANVHLVILDSNSWGTSARKSEQYGWLERDLAENRSGRWNIVAFHHPLFSAHDKRPIHPARWDWCPAFQDWGIDLVLTGHDHFYYRSRPIGQVTEPASRGIVHITTAGGGAPLYKLKSRTYTAVSESVHHISVLDFVGDEIHGQVVDMDGRVLDQYALTKSPTPRNELCSYEVYDMERAIRQELESRPVTTIQDDQHAVTLDEELRVAHRFRVPVRARVSWSDQGEGAGLSTELTLTPGAPCVIPVRRTVSVEPLRGKKRPEVSQLPRMNVIFEDERFINKAIEFCPLKLWPDRALRSRSVQSLDEFTQIWREATGSPTRLELVNSDGMGPAHRPGDVVALHSTDNFAFVTTVQDPSASSQSGEKDAEVHRDPEAMTRGKHIRLQISDDKYTYSFVVSPDGKKADARNGNWSFEEPGWRARVQGNRDQWSAAISIPRSLFSRESLRINVVHADPGRDIEDCLSPTFDPGTDPDRVPHYRIGLLNSGRFARLVLD